MEVNDSLIQFGIPISAGIATFAVLKFQAIQHDKAINKLQHDTKDFGVIRDNIKNLTDRQDSVRESLKELFHRLNTVESDTKIQREQIENLRKESEELFRQSAKLDETLNNFNGTLQSLIAKVDTLLDQRK